MDFMMIPPGDIDKYVENPDVLIIDLRTPQEYMERHIKNAVNIPYEKLQGVCMFPMDMYLLLYCERGATSLAAAKELADKGYKVMTVVGGIHAYRGYRLDRNGF